VKIHAISLVAILFFGIVASGIPNAHATVFNCAASMDGAQSNAGAGTGSAGTGTAAVTFNDVSGVLSWNIMWSGLGSPEIAMHFHGAALPNQNAGVQVGIGDITTPSSSNAVIVVAQAADLLSDLWYINLHTQQFPGGEIRGQVLCDTPSAVGGEFIGIDSVSVLVAGAQNTAAWMIPVLLSVIGIGIVIARKF